LYTAFIVGNFFVRNLSTPTTTISHENSTQEDTKL